MRAIASITTTRERLNTCDTTLRSLLDCKAFDVVYLNTSFLVDPQFFKDRNLTSVVNTIYEKDLGPIMKIVPTLLREQEPDTVIFYGDDDHRYTPNLLNKLVDSVHKNPDKVSTGLIHNYYGPQIAGHAGVAFRRGNVDANVILSLVHKHVYDGIANTVGPCKISDDVVLSHFFINICKMDPIVPDGYSFEYEQILSFGEKDGIHTQHNLSDVYSKCRTSLISRST